MSKTKEINVLGCGQQRTHRKKYQIALEADKNNPSFVIYNHRDRSKATRASRVSLLDGTYTGMNKLNREQLYSLVRFLESDCKATGFRHLTNWQRALIMFNESVINLGRNWERFTKRVKRNNREKWKSNKYKFALPIDLKMPDYMASLS